MSNTAGRTATMRAHATVISKVTGRGIQTTMIEVYRVQDELIIDGDVYYKDPTAVLHLADSS